MTSTETSPQRYSCNSEDLLMIHSLFRNAFSWAPDLVEQADLKDDRRVKLVSDHLGYLLHCAPREDLRHDFWARIPWLVRAMYCLFGKQTFAQEWTRLYGRDSLRQPPRR